MHPAVAFMRAFPARDETLCSEPVVEWVAPGALSKEAQRATLEKAGFWCGIRRSLRAIGFRLVRPDAVEIGEPVVVLGVNGVPVCGLMGPGGRALVLIGRTLGVAELPVLFVARKVS